MSRSILKHNVYNNNGDDGNDGGGNTTQTVHFRAVKLPAIKRAYLRVTLVIVSPLFPALCALFPRYVLLPFALRTRARSHVSQEIAMSSKRFYKAVKKPRCAPSPFQRWSRSRVTACWQKREREREPMLVWRGNIRAIRVFASKRRRRRYGRSIAREKNNTPTSPASFHCCRRRRRILYYVTPIGASRALAQISEANSTRGRHKEKFYYRGTCWSSRGPTARVPSRFRRGDPSL